MRRIGIYTAITVVATLMLCHCSAPAKREAVGHTIRLTDSLLTGGHTDTLPLGHITPGEVIEKRFWIVNETQRPIVLLDYRTSCGCVQLCFDRRPVVPNQSREITCRFDSAGQYGPTLNVVSLQVADAPATIDILLPCDLY